LLQIALWIALALAALTLLTAITKAALEADAEQSRKAESLSFVRLTLTGVFGVVVGEAFTPVRVGSSQIRNWPCSLFNATD
jgi:hypothetical protein